MRTTRPVFESFNAFVSFINEAEDATMTFDEFLASNSSFFDDDAKLGFDAMKIAATRAPLAIGTDGAELKKLVGTNLGALNVNIKELIAGNKETMKKRYNLRLTGKTTTEVKKVVYPALINGKVALTSDVGRGLDGALIPLYASLESEKLADLNDLLTGVNLRNTQAYYANEYPDPKKNGYANGWWPVEDQEVYARHSGAYQQLIISSIDSGIDFGDNGVTVPGVPILAALDFKTKNGSKVDDEKIYKTYVLYGVGNIVQGAGDKVPATLVKKDFTTTTVPGTETPYQVPIDGGDAMFEQGSATINTKNKIEIDKMLTAALAPLAGKPKSIVITGGASYEPDGQGPINKKLVVDRANAVMTYLETLYPELKGLITVNDKDFSKIQAKDEPKEYEKFRKVYLDITGVLQGASYEKKENIEYLINGVIKADTVEIIQYAITLEFYTKKG